MQDLQSWFKVLRYARAHSGHPRIDSHPCLNYAAHTSADQTQADDVPEKIWYG